MTRFQKWMLKQIFRQEVRQGFDHDRRITNLYAMIREAARNEFTEDNEPTADSFLRECFEKTQWAPIVPGCTMNKDFLPLDQNGKLVPINEDFKKSSALWSIL
jgi:hypothetical protein